MWTLIAGAVPAIVTLIVKAILDAGGRVTRARELIVADIQLLALVPAGFDVSPLRDRIATRLEEYSRPADVPQSFAAKQIIDTERWTRRTTRVGLAAAAATLGSAVAATVSVFTGSTPDWQLLASVVLTTAIGALAVFGTWQVAEARRRHNETAFAPKTA
ncbi:MAG: hypothetical protein JWQ74_671 [Marmoricola sp.]|nr:hypothetical protein [Marmoricola sp.]